MLYIYIYMFNVYINYTHISIHTIKTKIYGILIKLKYSFPLSRELKAITRDYNYISHINVQKFLKKGTNKKNCYKRGCRKAIGP